MNKLLNITYSKYLASTKIASDGRHHILLVNDDSSLLYYYYKWNFIRVSDGCYKIQSSENPNLYLVIDEDHGLTPVMGLYLKETDVTSASSFLFEPSNNDPQYIAADFGPHFMKKSSEANSNNLVMEYLAHDFWRFVSA